MPELNDGTTLPDIGFGTYPLRGEEGTAAVLSALEAGYRLIDTAVNYRNEDAVGRAIAETPVPRDEIIVATKVPGQWRPAEWCMAPGERVAPDVATVTA